ncbi:hypothetical protein BC835DRAFT_539835 [Cytidiella melzeri]|nr:hypothetical protein BC835DRAFT_539835 [Cytidiella melzeri]
MSTMLEHKTKKRKHAAAETAGHPSTKRPKTGKDSQHNQTRDGKKKKKTREPTHGQFKVVRATLAISIPPVFASRPREGAEEMLDSVVMRYVPALQGVLLAYENLQFMSTSAIIKGDCPFANCTITFDATVWSPRVGMQLVGRVNLCSPDHVSLLVHRTFNVSIPRHHIPADSWEFEYGPAENDPEYGGTTADELKGTTPTSNAVESSGRWVHKLTDEKLGGESGRLDFTVIGLTIANQMLSLIGSIQHDPFSSQHVPNHSLTATVSGKRLAAQTTLVYNDVDWADKDTDNEEDVDTFEILARSNNEKEEKNEGRNRKKVADEDADRNEKKRKRKAEKAAVQAESDGRPEKQKKKRGDKLS